MANLTNKQVSNFLRSQPLIRGLDEIEVSYLVDVIETVIFDPGETVFPEGECSNDLYFIFEGEVNVLKTDQKTGQQYSLGILKSGNAFGDLAFLDDEPRSSSIKTIKQTTLLKLSKETSYSTSSEMLNIYHKMMNNISKITLQRMRDTNQGFIQNINDEMNRLQTIINGGQLLLIAFLMMWVSKVVASPIQDLLDRAWFEIVLQSGLLSFILYQFYSEFGLSFLDSKQWKIHYKETFAVIGSLIAVTLAAWAIRKFVSLIYPDMHFVQFVSLTWNIALLTYPLYVFLCEFVMRGIIQTNLKIFIRDKNGLKTVIYTAFALSAIKLPISFDQFFVYFILNCALGYFYNRRPQLIAVTLLHCALGLLLIMWGIIQQPL